MLCDHFSLGHCFNDVLVVSSLIKGQTTIRLCCSLSFTQVGLPAWLHPNMSRLRLAGLCFLVSAFSALYAGQSSTLPHTRTSIVEALVFDASSPLCSILDPVKAFFKLTRVPQIDLAFFITQSALRPLASGTPLPRHPSEFSF